MPIRRADGTERVGRLNSAGCWELASYQKCRHQYMASDVVEWFDTEAWQPKELNDIERRVLAHYRFGQFAADMVTMPEWLRQDLYILLEELEKRA